VKRFPLRQEGEGNGKEVILGDQDGVIQKALDRRGLVDMCGRFPCVEESGTGIIKNKKGRKTISPTRGDQSVDRGCVGVARKSRCVFRSLKPKTGLWGTNLLFDRQHGVR